MDSIQRVIKGHMILLAQSHDTPGPITATLSYHMVMVSWGTVIREGMTGTLCLQYLHYGTYISGIIPYMG